MFERLSLRFPADDMIRLRQAYTLAKEAHEGQKRAAGDPYIMHPVAVARIVAEEFMLDANSIVAAFLHDVVEDTPYTIEDIRERFGDDVAFLVKVVTKPCKIAGAAPDVRKQENNFRPAPRLPCATTSAPSLSSWQTACTICAHSDLCSPKNK